MAIPFDQDATSDKRLMGRAKRLQGMASGTSKQAPDLSAEQVAKLERLVCREDTCVTDRFLAGGLLFALFSRSRWSDLKMIDAIWIDEYEPGLGL